MIKIAIDAMGGDNGPSPIIEGLISRLVNGDPDLNKIINKIAQDKNNADLRKVIGTDAESVYDLLETYDAIKKED